MPDASHSVPRQLDVVIVGGGLAGLYAIHRLRSLGLKVRAYEAGSGVGGTWFWNRYPGARCDVESLEYSYSFSEELQQEWKWPERYGTQPEILKYINHVADRFDLRRDVQLNTRIKSAVFDAGGQRMGGEDRHRRGDPRALLRDGGGQPLDAAGARLQGHPRLQGQVVPLRPVAARGRRLHRPARRRGRHRLVGRADDPDHRPAGQAPDGVPAHRQLQPAGAQRRRWRKSASASTRPSIRRDAPRRWTRRSRSAAIPSRPGRRSISRKRSATRPTKPKWQEGGSISYLYAYTDLLVNKASNDTASEFVRNKIRGMVKDQEDRRAAGAQGSSDRHQAALPRYQLLRDLQSAERVAGRRAQRSDPGDHRDGPAARFGRRASSSTPSSSPPASTP